MKHRISEIGVQMLEYQEQLAREHKYKPIPRTFFSDVRTEFQNTLLEWCNISGDTTPLETTDGTIIANGYNAASFFKCIWNIKRYFGNTYATSRKANNHCTCNGERR